MYVYFSVGNEDYNVYELYRMYVEAPTIILAFLLPLCMLGKFSWYCLLTI